MIKDLKNLAPGEETNLNFFIQIIDRVHLIGLGSLGLEPANAPINLKQLHSWIKRDLNMLLPATFSDSGIFKEFVKQYFGLLRTANQGQKITIFDIELSEGEEDILTTSDLRVLRDIIVVKRVQLKDAMVITVQTAQHIMRLRQHFFEPLFNEFSNKDLTGTLGVATTFYQALLHLGRCHTYLGGVDAKKRHEISQEITHISKMLVSTIKTFKPLQNVYLTKFVQVCLDYGLEQFLPAVLRRNGKQHLLTVHYTLKNIFDLVLVLEPGNVRSNHLIHAKIRN